MKVRVVRNRSSRFSRCGSGSVRSDFTSLKPLLSHKHPQFLTRTAATLPSRKLPPKAAAAARSLRTSLPASGRRPGAESGFQSVPVRPLGLRAPADAAGPTQRRRAGDEVTLRGRVHAHTRRCCWVRVCIAASGGAGAHPPSLLKATGPRAWRAAAGPPLGRSGPAAPGDANVSSRLR